MQRQHSAKKQPENKGSMLLTDQENRTVFNLMGRKRVALSTTVVQVLLSYPDPSRWEKKHCGVAVFVKDNPNRSYYIRVFDIQKLALIWEHELYNQFKYNTPLACFHTFSTDSCQAGLNFANDKEAAEFKNAIIEKISLKEKKKIERKRQSSQKKTAPTAQRPASGVAPNTAAPTYAPSPDISTATSYAETKKKKDKKKEKEKDKDKDKGPKKLTKADTGLPTDFRHVGHVGWDPEKGFDMNNLDPDLKDLFDMAGISESQLKDKETSKMIYDFIESQGGLEAVKQDNMRRKASASTPDVVQTATEYETAKEVVKARQHSASHPIHATHQEPRNDEIALINERFYVSHHDPSFSSHHSSIPSHHSVNVEPLLDTPMVQMVMEMGYRQDSVKQALERRIRSTGDNFPNTEDLLQAVWEIEDDLNKSAAAAAEPGEKTGQLTETSVTGGEGGDETAPPPVGSLNSQPPDRALTSRGGDPTHGAFSAPPNIGTAAAASGSSTEIEKQLETLKDRVMCKVCMDNDACMLFLPCKHVVTCEDCASSLRKCPVCRSQIQTSTKIFF